ncbi:group II intron reverse transcriptase/maturase, partial [Geitlerinema sp. P-1104]|uniref:group II intron reverse transcriptase/maturase n=1 Tax=Geitlerinema sp. P-1104 TaxID=2546230 RepID=UPI0014776A56
RDLPWGKIQRKVFKLQKAIYQAVNRGNKAKARRLQRLLQKSYYARLLAVRKVTQDNQGNKTAGVDGVKSVNIKDRFHLVEDLRKPSKAKSLRRVWIPKPGRDEKRPLGIPTMHDRALQALVKLGLEPYWEAQFEAESYGFRPGRSAHDAIDAIFKKCRNTQYVLDADIAKCFDRINHDYLLSKLGCPTVYKRLIRQWLKTGVMDNGAFDATEAGTPQGGVISPLLANIALHGMIDSVVNRFPKRKSIDGKQDQSYRPKIIRYADDFVVLANKPEVVLEAKRLIEEWLKPVGLELKPEKTRLCNTLTEWNGEEPGFDFLGFKIRQYPCSIHKGVNAGTAGGKKRYQLHIKPSKKAVKTHYNGCKEVIKRFKTAPQAALIKKLNPIIRGWSNYYSKVVSKGTFSKLDHMIWKALRAWTVSRCGKATQEKLDNYFSQGKHGKWTYQTKDGTVLLKHQETPIARHVKVKGSKSPYDGDWAYWNKRMSNGYGDIPTRVANLIKRQKGRCNHCGQYFTSDDLVEIDHIQPKSKGGKDEYSNLQLLHRHCHDDKTRKDGSLTDNSPHDKG